MIDLIKSMGRMTVVVLLMFFFVSSDERDPGRFGNVQFDSLLRVADELMYTDFATSDSLYGRAEELLAADNHKYPFTSIDLNNRRAIACIYNSRFGRGRRHIDECLDLLDRFFKDDIDPLVDSLRNGVAFTEALYFWNIGDYDGALRNLNTVAEFTKAHPLTPARCENLFRILQFQASIYRIKGEYESAVNEYLASNAYYDCYRDTSQCGNYVLTYRNVGNTLFNTGDYERALEYFWRGEANLSACSSQDPSPAWRTLAVVLHHSIGEVYIKMNMPDSADFYFRKAVADLDQNSSFASRIYSGLGKVALLRGDFNKARRYLEDALGMLRNRFGEKHRDVSAAYQELAALFQSKGDNRKALQLIQAGLNSLSGMGTVDSVVSSNPSLKSVSSKKAMIQLLSLKSRLLLDLYHRTNDDTLLSLSRKTNGLALQLVDSSRHELTFDKDKVILADESVRVYGLSIRIASELFRLTKDRRYVEEAFELIDKSKSSVLLDHVKMVSHFSRIPTTIIEREKELQSELSSAEEALFRIETEGGDASSARVVLAELKKARAAMQREIRSSYPRYYALLIENKHTTINEVQQDVLAKGEAMVQYFLDDTTLYTVFVSNDTATLLTIHADELNDDIAKFRRLTIEPGRTDEHQPSDVAERLFQSLVSPWRSLAGESVSSLIIIPHGPLTYVPFEALTNGGRLLLEDLAICYANSARLYNEQRQMIGKGSSFAGFNANYTDHEFLPPLAGTSAEVTTIKELVGGNSEILLDATADDFRRHAPGYRVVHLALHTIIEDEKPLFSRLAFTSRDSTMSDAITANELYSMELGAELVVLSACETGIGKLNRGEGMMSLSRAFMYAGVPSTVMSLWKVPDQATSLLMTGFYKYLADGLPKHEALANAKRDFIRQYPQMSAPYFWAGFIINGKTDPVSFSSPLPIWPIAISVILLGVIVVWARRKGRLKV